MKWWRVGGAVLLLLVVFSIGARPRRELRVIFCDVGQGDGSLIIKGSFQALIDTGPKNGGVSACLGKYLPFWDRNIEVLINSHPEADHLGDLAAVASRYRIEMLVMDGKIPPRGELGDEVRKLVEGGTKLKTAQAGDTIRYSTLRFDVLWPTRKSNDLLAYLEDGSAAVLGKENSLNQYALVTKLTYGRFTGLFTGDIGVAEEMGLLESGLLGGVDLLKVAHHGSKYSSSREFLEVVRPKLALISVGKNNYGHPTVETLTRLKEVGAKIIRTDQAGDVEIDSDGQTFFTKDISSPLGSDKY
jgi:competence protein ComEC